MKTVNFTKRLKAATILRDLSLVNFGFIAVFFFNFNAVLYVLEYYLCLQEKHRQNTLALYICLEYSLFFVQTFPIFCDRYM